MEGDLVYAGALFVSGLASGFAGGLFGIGGGLLRVPLFLYLFPAFGVAPEVTMHLAAGTSLAVAVPGTISACRTQHQSGNMDMAFVRSWVPPLLVGVLVGLGVQRYAPSHVLILVFAVVLFLQALQMLVGGEKLHFASEVPTGPRRWGIAAFIGALSVALGISGGAFTTPTLVAMAYPLRKALAVSTATALSVASVGAIGSIVNGFGATQVPRFSLGYVDLLAVAVMVPAVLLTSPMGVKTANRMNKQLLSRVFAIFLILVASDMAFDFFERG